MVARACNSRGRQIVGPSDQPPWETLVSKNQGKDQWEGSASKTLATELEGLSLSPETHVRRKELTLESCSLTSKRVSSYTYAHACTCACTHTHAQAHNQICEKKVVAFEIQHRQLLYACTHRWRDFTHTHKCTVIWTAFIYTYSISPRQSKLYKQVSL